ncbi:MAG TPA: hypothetical protein VIF82_04385 [Burkholderiaceae bacterium]|jgi:hypothetical protein
MAPLIRKHYGESWWDAELPERWTFRCDQSIKGWPFSFESPRGSTLKIQTFCYPLNFAGDVLTTLTNFSLEKQKERFCHLIDQASNKVEAIKILDQDFFYFKIYKPDELPDRWMMNLSGFSLRLWAKFQSPDESFKEDSIAAVNIVKTIRIYEPGNPIQPKFDKEGKSLE